jgi:hypothetical protein
VTITAADAMQVMLTVQACHHRTAPRMDDQQVTRATATIWAELFNEYQLDIPDLVAAVKKRALGHADAPEPAEIIEFAREIRRDRSARHGPTSEYEARCEAKSADAAELAAIRDRREEIERLADAKGIDRA